jgi:arylsulfatase A-like enzyme
VAFLSDSPKEPFLLSVGLTETHIPFPDPDPDHYPAEDHRYVQPPSPLPDAEVTRRNMAGFIASARHMDEKYGSILEALGRRGLDERTIVCCFSDHGLQVPRNMCNLTDHGIGVYCIIRGPGGFTGGKVVDGMISLIDLIPTVYEVAEIDTPDHVEGTSLAPMVRESAATHRDATFAEVNFHAAYEPMRCVRTDRYKFIRRYDNRAKPVLPNMDDGPSKDFLLKAGWTERKRDQEMLYDLIFDPTEAENLVDRSEYADARRELSTLLDEWMAQTGDPIRKTGALNLPEGCIVNDADGHSPKEAPGRM